MLWKNPKHSQADQAPKIPYKYTATQHKNMGQKFKSLVWGYNDVAHATPNVEREAETRRGMKNSVICLPTGGVPKLLIENAKPFLQECVCVCTMRGMGVLQMHGGRELVLLLSLASQLDILLIAPLPSPAASAPFLSSFLSLFQGEFILSLVHCGE